jgi:lipopolysaccharide-binding protein
MSSLTPSLSLQGEIFNPNHRSPEDFLAPAMSLPEDHEQMVYFAISGYVFNMASLVYHQEGQLNFSITDDMVRMSAERALAPFLSTSSRH